MKDVAVKASDRPGGKPALELIAKGVGVPGVAAVKRAMNAEDVREVLFGPKMD